MGDVSREAAEAAIDVLLQERREFPPPPEFVSQAVASDPGIYERAEADLDGFWLDQTRSLLDWHQDADQGARVGPAALHVVRRRHPEREPQLPRPARRCRSRRQGRLPLRPRAGRRGGAGDHLLPTSWPTSAGWRTHCARSGSGRATSSGSTWAWCRSFPSRCSRAPGSGRRTSSSSGASRPSRSVSGWSRPTPRLVITQDEAWRKGAGVALKATADEAVKLAPSVENMVVLRRTGADVAMQDGRDHWWHELVRRRSRTPASPSRSRPSTCSTPCTHRARRRSRRPPSTPRAAT